MTAAVAVTDSTVALRILTLLSTPFTKWPAFQTGLIDGNGKVIRKMKPTDRDNWTPLHRLIAKLKEILKTTPQSATWLSKVTAAFYAVPPMYHNNTNYMMNVDRGSLKNNFDKLMESLTNEQIETVKSLLEETSIGSGAVPATGALGPTDEPPASKKRNPRLQDIIRRKS